MHDRVRAALWFAGYRFTSVFSIIIGFCLIILFAWAGSEVATPLSWVLWGLAGPVGFAFGAVAWSISALYCADKSIHITLDLEKREREARK